MSNSRKPIPVDIETEVLMRSKRRCCLCVGLNGDLSIKQIQIAHIDHDPSNNKPKNLVAICLPHHDDYDTRRSQSKGITPEEIRQYQQKLDAILQARDEQLVLPVVGTDKMSTPSARLLGHVLSAFDNDMRRIQENGRSNGIALSKIGRSAIEDDGDFDVAKEAYISLIRLSAASQEKGINTSIRQPVPTATPTLAALEVLLTMQKDFSLFIDTVHRSRLWALIGNAPFKALSEYENIPHIFFDSITDILVTACMKCETWAKDPIVSELTKLLLGIGYVLTERGIELPEPPSQLVIRGDGKRWIGKDQRDELLPFVQLINKIASLPHDLFELTLTRLAYKVNLMVSVSINEKTTIDKSETLEVIKRWAIIPQYALVVFPVNDETIKDECIRLVSEVNKKGTGVGLKIKEILLAERSLLYKKRTS